MQMFKEDTRREEGKSVPIKCIEAAQELTNIIKTNLGPNGLSKLVENHLGKVIVTRRTETVLFNIVTDHPIAKLIVLAAQHQAQEIGDGTTQVVAFIGEVLLKLKPLVSMLLPVKDIQEGLDLALAKTLELLPTFVCDVLKSYTDAKEVARCLKPVVQAKMMGQEDFIASLIANACVDICPTDPSKFNVDNVRFTKIMGGSLTDSVMINGFCLQRPVEGTIKHIKNAKIAVFGCAINKDEGETAGTIVLKTASELESYTASEEQRMKALCEQICSTGAKVVISGANISEIALHYLEQLEVMVIRVGSKFDLQRLCLATHSTALVRLGAPLPEELGFCASVDETEVSGNQVVIFSQQADLEKSESLVESRIATIILRSSTQAQLDDVERVCIDAVNTFKVLTRDNRLVAGGGAFEAELSKKLGDFGKTNVGLQQYAIGAFADALLFVPRIIGETSGMDSNQVTSAIVAAHAKEGGEHMGVNVETLEISDMKKAGVIDTLLLKEWVIRFGIETVKTIMSVDEIIMAKPAGIKPPPSKTIGAADND
ncbi:putative T-complex protein 1 subunit theta [Blattamonas nauphoetae]|uniref:CCT-theta n=1 Tax=Blattamonas nauphoetae TaxID=2049346 RepID=A0ABQ9Y6J9_9EUKA|nr:putative T-complex protein 1 subunit theta [Blattamonas nauphoetae]